MLLPRWQQTLRDHRDQAAILDERGTLRFRDLAEALAALPRADAPVLAHGDALAIVLATLRGWRDGQPVLPLEKPDTTLPPLDGLPADVAHLKLTPGNDGRPRSVRFRAAQIAADADRIVAAMDLRPEVPNLATISLSHSYGYSSIILPLLLHGIPIRTVAVPFPAVVAAAWKDHPRVVVPAVPSMWRAWHRSGILDSAPIALALSAGAPLPLALERSIWNDHRLKLHNFYGASECGGISFDTTTEPRHTEGELGTPLPGVRVTPDPDGRLVVASDAVALGYDEPRSDERLGDGVFRTPDHGHLDGGRVILDGREAGHINVAGRKLGPGRVEQALLATGRVSRVRVFGLESRDPDRVEEVAALVPPGTDLADLRRAAAGQLAGWELPRHWFESAAAQDWALPRRELRARFARSR